MAPTVNRALTVRKETAVRPDPCLHGSTHQRPARACLARPDPKDRPDHLANPAKLARREVLEVKLRTENLDRLDPADHQVQQAHQAQEANPARKANPVAMPKKEKKVPEDPKERKDHQDQPDQPATKARPPRTAHQALEVPPDHPVKEENPETKDPLDRPVRQAPRDRMPITALVQDVRRKRPPKRSNKQLRLVESQKKKEKDPNEVQKIFILLPSITEKSFLFSLSKNDFLWCTFLPMLI